MSAGVFGSAFPLSTGGSREIVYTIINRKPNATGVLPQIQPNITAQEASQLHFYDCYRGQELNLDPVSKALSFNIEGGGYGCVLATPNATDQHGMNATLSDQTIRGPVKLKIANLTYLLRVMRAMTAHPIASFSAQFHVLRQRMVSINSTRLRSLDQLRDDEVYVPSTQRYQFDAEDTQLEGFDPGMGQQFDWEGLPTKRHSHSLPLGALIVDKYPVTVAKYATYLNKTGYQPRDALNWLKGNFEGDQRTPRAGWEQKPVTFVSLEDARQYCQHEGKRLPHSYEWQYFASGGDGRTQPWGSEPITREDLPAISHDWENTRGPDPVGQHPRAASPFGVEDLVQHVWQYTDAFEDEHTASVMLFGGSSYGPWRGIHCGNCAGVASCKCKDAGECRWTEGNPMPPPTPENPDGCIASNANYSVPGSAKPHVQGGSFWYFPPAVDLTRYGKMFTMSGSWERASTVSFRCVADAVDDCGTGGHLCIEQTRAKAAIQLNQTLVDWLLYSRDTERKADIDNMTTIGSLVPLDPSVTSANGSISFAFTGGQPVVSGSRSGALEFQGAGNGFTLTSPAPAAGTTHVLTLYLGSTNSQTNLSAVVPTVRGANHSAEVYVKDGAMVVMWYKGGPLHVQYCSVTGSTCDSTLCQACQRGDSSRVCFKPALPVSSDIIDLSRHDVIAWAHFGGSNRAAKAPWYTDCGFGANQTGPWSHQLGALVAPKLVDHDGNTLVPVRYSLPAPKFVWGAGGHPSSTAGVNGSPLVQGGVYSTHGIFSITIPALGTSRSTGDLQRWQLTLYVGLCETTGNLTAAIGKEIVASEAIELPVGQRVGNAARSIVFDATQPITIAWMASGAQTKMSNICLQAAVLERAPVGPGSVLIQAATLAIKHEPVHVTNK